MLLLLPLAIASCGSDGFDLPISGTIAVAGSGSSEIVTGPLPPIDGLTAVSLTELPAFHDAGLKPGSVTSAKLKKLTLQAEDGSALDFIQYVELYAEAKGEPKVKIGEKHVPDGARSVDLDIDSVELAPYVSGSPTTISGSATRRALKDDAHLRLDAVLHVSGTGLPF